MKEINKELYDKIKVTKYSAKEKEIIYNYCVENEGAEKELKSITSKAKYSKFKFNFISKQLSHISMLTLGSIVTIYLVLLHIYEVMNNVYIINEVLSWIIASIALIGFIVCMVFKYKLIKGYAKLKNYIIADSICFIGALVIKLFMSSTYDFSIIVVFIDYLINKSFIEKATGIYS